MNEWTAIRRKVLVGDVSKRSTRRDYDVGFCLVKLAFEFVHSTGSGSRVTAHPDAGWVTQQARNVTCDLEDEGVKLKFLLRDRDTKCARSFDEVFASAGARVLRTPFRIPNANAHAERFVRTVRSECLDHLLIVNARHLERVLRGYVRHYNRYRPHQGLSQETPADRPTTSVLAARSSLDGPSRRRHRQFIGGTD